MCLGGRGADRARVQGHISFVHSSHRGHGVLVLVRAASVADPRLFRYLPIGNDRGPPPPAAAGAKPDADEAELVVTKGGGRAWVMACCWDKMRLVLALWKRMLLRLAGVNKNSLARISSGVIICKLPPPPSSLNLDGNPLGNHITSPKRCCNTGSINACGTGVGCRPGVFLLLCIYTMVLSSRLTRTLGVLRNCL